MLHDFWVAFVETGLMMGIAIAFAVVIGVPLGIGLFVTNRGMFFENRFIQQVAGTTINIIRSIPYIILLVVLIPLTQLLTGSSTGPIAASVSLTIAAIPFYRSEERRVGKECRVDCVRHDS